MDIQEIDLGNTVVRACLQDSTRLVVGFENGAGKAAQGGDAWAQGIARYAGWDGLHIMPKTLNWYQASDLWDYFHLAGKTGFFEGYESVVTYGSSMGGFAAMAFAKLIGAQRVVAIQPRSTLRWTLPWRSEQSDNMVYNRVGPHADAVDGLTPEMDVQVFADPFFARDWNHAKRVPRATLYRVPLVKHNVPRVLKEIGILSEVARRAIDGRLEPSWFREQMRGRGRSVHYQFCLEKALSRRQPEGAVIKHGIRQLGPNPKTK